MSKLYRVWAIPYRKPENDPYELKKSNGLKTIHSDQAVGIGDHLPLKFDSGQGGVILPTPLTLFGENSWIYHGFPPNRNLAY